MANIFTTNPFVLDTVWTKSTIPAAILPPTSATDTTNKRNAPVVAQRIVWHGSTAAGTVLIADINDNVIAEFTLAAADTTQIGTDIVVYDAGNAGKRLPLKMGGWVLKTLGSGTCIIYYN